MLDRKAIRDAYAENEASMKRLVPFMTEDDVQLCLELTAEQTCTSYQDARSVMIDEWAMVGSG
jgi:hypothetical protein